ncbi:DUF4192 domain-containing protein [Blastococcus saxobsidens]|uniref:DUF4192 domain-containing protein n=1 Tax=Blastococcus saxobsidens (strain DD2) TaxID=1146883 RepID=H6RS14_BLASD|nr:DUF4192 domain-containing protein [Blastococcus saxobsidens]CCG04208.1 conserved protein of unknown function [Blastococcus saxobsidens DD2]
MDAPADAYGTDRPEVRISDPGEVVAALPHLLGFHPRESVVLVGLGGPTGGRVGLTVRGDLPPAGAAGAAARQLVASLRSDAPTAALLVVVSDDPDDLDPRGGDEGADGALVSGTQLPHRPLVHELLLVLSAADLPVRDVLLVRRGRWWSYDCPYPCCAPAAGTPLPDGVSELAVAAVATGQVVAADRAALSARIAAPPGARGGMRAACTRAAARRTARLGAVGPAVLTDESWAALVRAVARCRPGPGGGGPLEDHEVADLLWALRDPQVRDSALQLALGADAAAAETLWTECTRRAPAPLDAAPATLLAVSVWLRGDGAMANVALDRAMDSDPDLALARLLSQGLAACLPPRELRALLEQAAGAGGPARRPA